MDDRNSEWPSTTALSADCNCCYDGHDDGKGGDQLRPDTGLLILSTSVWH
jgi:hypothetical protein